MRPTKPQLSVDPEVLLAEGAHLRTLAIRLVRDAHVADDIVQDTYVAALENTSVRQWRGWLAVVARNFALRARHAESLRRSHEQRAARPEGEADTPGDVERVERYRQLTEAVLALREPYRGAIIMRFFDGLSPRAIAKREGVDSAVVRQRVSRGLTMLRRHLDREFGGDRKAWCLALGALASGGGVIMTAKTGLAGVVAVAVFLAGVLYWSEASETTRPSTKEQSSRVLSENEVGGRATVESENERQRIEPETRADLSQSVSTNLDQDTLLRGRVLDPQGNLVCGASVEIRREDMRERSIDELAFLDFMVDRTEIKAKTRTDEQGEFTFDVPQGRAHDLAVVHGDYAERMVPGVYAGEFVDVHLSEGASLEGLVLRESDLRPLQGLVVSAWRNDEGRHPVFECVTDSRGTFSFTNLDPASITVEVVGKGLLASTYDVVQVIAGETTKATLTLSTGLHVSGVVLDEETGLPVSGASIGENWRQVRKVFSASDGTFEFTGFDPDGGALYVSCTGFGSQVVRISRDRPPVEVTIELTRGGRVRGWVFDENGDTVEQAYVAAVARSQKANGALERDWVSSRTDKDGSFEIRDLRTDLAHALFVVHGGCGSAVIELPGPDPDGNIDAGVILLSPGARVSGVVTDEHGNELGGCRVSLQRRRERKNSGDTIEVSIDRRRIRTDAQGRFDFFDLSPGAYIARVTPRGAGASDDFPFELLADERSRRLDIEVAMHNHIRGRVLDRDGKPQSNIHLILSSELSRDPIQSLLTDEDGAFEFVDLQEGAYRLEGREVDGTPQRPRRGLQPIRLESLVAGTDRLEVTMLQGALTEGRVVDSAGNPLEGVWIMACDQEGRVRDRTETDHEGRFKVRPEQGIVVDLLAVRPIGGEEFYSVGVESLLESATRTRVSSGSRDVRIVMR